MKKRWKVFFVGVLAVAVFFSVLLIRQVVALQNAECVIRVDFNSLEYLFHVPHEYYAINEKEAVKVSEFLAKQFCGDSVATKSIYDENDVNYWYVELEYAEDDSCFDDVYPYVETSWGDKYRLTYRTWGNSSRWPNEEELLLFRKMAEEFHSGNPEECIVEGKSRTLTSFTVVNYQERYMFTEHSSETIHFVTDTGGFSEIISCPGHGTDYYFWF